MGVKSWFFFPFLARNSILFCIFAEKMRP